MRGKLILWIGVLGTLAYACTYDNTQDIKPKNAVGVVIPCDSADSVITYSKHIVPIMVNLCGSTNSCHNTSGAGGNIILETYNDVAYAAATGKLISCITWDGNTKLMPQNSSTKIDDCYIIEIQRWVNAGFPNN